MLQLSTWQEFGFRDNPYSTDAIQTTGEQWRLLVGREKELKKISRQLNGGAPVVSLEGNFGVGKTSLAAVAAHQATTLRAAGGPLFITTSKPLSLRPSDTVETFERRAFQQIAAALIGHADVLKKEGRPLRGLEDLKLWLLSPTGSGWNAALGLNLSGYGGSLGGGKSRTPSTSPGFTEAGVIQMIDGWLTELFPDRSSGGVICFIDNLEELKDTKIALDVLQPLRDPLLKRKGVRWIISGAQGIVRAAFASQKMYGVFLNPIEVPPIDSKLVPDVIERRARLLSMGEEASLPVSKHAFRTLYESIGYNLRYSLNLAERFCYDSDPDELVAKSEEERDEEFKQFILQESELVYKESAETLTKSDWAVFDKLLRDKAGSCSPSDFADFGYAGPSPLITRVNKLVAAHLVDYVIDESDLRRRSINATDHGRLAFYRHLHA
ncbi:hypothetical protein ACETK3_21165 [Arthrobacter sp. E44]|uniref:hypothetical protein n=1 Tax=Arthrobacter sp. E44 TaxID=3341794 RepID=UPI0035A575D6